MSNRIWQPMGIALLTAFKESDKDYNWYIEVGQPVLLTEMKSLHYAMISDRNGDAPYLAVIVKSQRIGMLVGKMRTKRRDYVNRELHDTLYLEFALQDRQAVLSSVATLLATYDQDDAHQEYEQYERYFLDYAEALVEQGENISIPTPPPIGLPMYANMASDNCTFDYSEVAIFSTPDSRRKCARYLKKLAEEGELPKSVRVVSTGRVSKDDLQKYANTYTSGELIVLTLSDSIKGEEDLRSPGERLLPEIVREYLPAGWRWPFMGGIVVAVIMGLLLLFQDRTPPQLASLTMHIPVQPNNDIVYSITAQAGVFTIPRMGQEGMLRLSFTEKMQPKVLPRLEVSNGIAVLTFPQPCQSVDAQTWNCPVTFSSDDSNQSAAFTLKIADGKDKAGNRMASTDVKVNVESANMTAALVAQPEIVWHDLLTWQRIIVKVTAEHGVKKVWINNLKAVQDNLVPDRWQAEIPTYPTLEDQTPLAITVKDTYGNTVNMPL